MSAPILNSAELIARFTAYVKDFHSRYDPSHDYEHVRRVTLTALAIADSLNAHSEKPTVDTLVIHLAALSHDLLDKKYLPRDLARVPTAEEHLEAQGLWANVSTELVSLERRALIGQIVDNVSYSKEVKRIQAGQVTAWHEQCLELHAVRDADKLDAIGAFGIMRCMAYSGASNRPLFCPPASRAEDDAESASRPGDSAIDHFNDKLFKLEGMMRTVRGKELARERTSFMRTFVAQLESEWENIAGFS